MLSRAATGRRSDERTWNGHHRLDRARPARRDHRQGNPPGNDPGGIIVTIIIGIVGAILGGFLAQVLFGRNTVDEFFDISTWLTAIIGAILLLVVYRMVVGRGRRRVI